MPTTTLVPSQANVAQVITVLGPTPPLPFDERPGKDVVYCEPVYGLERVKKLVTVFVDDELVETGKALGTGTSTQKRTFLSGIFHSRSFPSRLPERK